MNPKLKALTLVLLVGFFQYSNIPHTNAQLMNDQSTNSQWLEEFSLAPENSVAAEEKAQALEGKLHRLFQIYHSVPTPPEVWQQMVGRLSQLNYEVQSGDTLFDISEVFFGDPQFWPKIWSLNNHQILNPHLIQPGMVISFSLGSSTEPPSVSVGTSPPPAKESLNLTNDDGEEVSGGSAAQVDDESELTPEALLKKMELYRKQGQPFDPYRQQEVVVDGGRVTAIPESFPEWNFKGPPQSKLAKVDFSSGAFMPEEKVRLLFYLSDAPPNEIGRFVAAETSQGEMQVQHFVLMRGADLAVGETYLVISPSLHIWSPRKRIWGRQWQINGVVRVLSQVNPRENLFRAQVDEAYTKMGTESILVRGSVRDMQIDGGIEGTGQGIEAQIVGGAGGSPRSMFSRGEVLYLDAGSSDGVREGLSFQIFRNEDARSQSLRGLVRQNAREIGLVRVIHVAENFSTAVVIDSTEEIRVGDRNLPQMTQ